jgi:hypothetical protein
MVCAAFDQFFFFFFFLWQSMMCSFMALICFIALSLAQTVNWSVEWQVNPGCSQSSCCCPTGAFSIVQVDLGIRLLVGVSGQCGIDTKIDVAFDLASMSSTSAVFSAISKQFNISITGTTLTLATLSSPVCSVTATCTNGPCTSNSGGTTATTTTPASSSGSCFHEETIIVYDSEAMSLEQLKTHADCVVPHTVTALGHIITAQCGGVTKTLRLTSGHLVYTQRGLLAARDISEMDTVFSDLKEQHACKVLNIECEKSAQQYFGLNCINSQVLASGIKASTFEKLHSVPSLWMAIMGRVFGIGRASKYGDYILQLATKINLVK